MVGVPKTLNSHDDYVYLKEHFPEDVWKPAWKMMWEQRKHWMPVKVLDKREDGIEDETHRLIEITNEMTGQVDEEGNPIEPEKKWQQEEYVDDPYSAFFWYGFTEEEVKTALGIK